MKQIEDIITIKIKNYPYIIERKRIKNIYFRVKEDLKIHISANHLVSHHQIRKLLIKNEEIILRMYEKIEQKEDSTLKYLGNKLQFIYQEIKPYIEKDIIYGINEEICDKYIYEIALDIFLIRLDRIKEQFNNLPSFKLKTRQMKTKWGVCNQKSMTITLNTELIKKEVHLIDYVIIHELCHFKHMNHSKEYWDYVSGFFPYYKQARKELKY